MQWYVTVIHRPDLIVDCRKKEKRRSRQVKAGRVEQTNSFMLHLEAKKVDTCSLWQPLKVDFGQADFFLQALALGCSEAK